MSVIIELSIPSDEIRLGSVLGVEGDAVVELRTVVPLGDRAVPHVRVTGPGHEAFGERLRDRREVASVTTVETFENESLYGVRWAEAFDGLFRSVEREGGEVLRALGTAAEWRFEVQFEDHAGLTAFQQRCQDRGVTFAVHRVYRPEADDDGRFELTDQQYESLVLAVREGYYRIPREATTAELADRLGISDQAVSERLRRGIDTLVTNALLDDADAETQLADDSGG